MADGLDGPRVIQVIVSQSRRGKGTLENPVRIVTEYHSLDGVFLAENEPVDYGPVASRIRDEFEKLYTR